MLIILTLAWKIARGFVQFVFFFSSHLMMSKAIQSQISWHWDFQAGPAPSFEEATSHQLAERTRLCFLEKCMSNVYARVAADRQGEALILKSFQSKAYKRQFLKLADSLNYKQHKI